MTCKVVKTPELTAIVCSRGQRPLRCVCCGRPADRLCDFVLEGGRTCDRAICAQCTDRPARGVDFCPEHAAIGRERAAR